MATRLKAAPLLKLRQNRSFHALYEIRILRCDFRKAGLCPADSRGRLSPHEQLSFDHALAMRRISAGLRTAFHLGYISLGSSSLDFRLSRESKTLNTLRLAQGRLRTRGIAEDYSNCLRKVESCSWISATSLRNSRTSFSRCDMRSSAEVRTWSDAGEGARATSTVGASPLKRCM